MFDFLKVSHLYKNFENEWSFFRIPGVGIIYYNVNHMEFDKEKGKVRIFIKYYTTETNIMRTYVEPEQAKHTYFGSMIMDIKNGLLRIDEGFLTGSKHTYFSEKQIPWRRPHDIEAPLMVFCRHMQREDVIVPEGAINWSKFLENDEEVGVCAIGDSGDKEHPGMFCMKLQSKMKSVIRYFTFLFKIPNNSNDLYDILPASEVVVRDNKYISAFADLDKPECLTFANCCTAFPMTTLRSQQELKDMIDCVDEILHYHFGIEETKTKK